MSRQLWWGHQLPIWYCDDGHVICSETTPDACAECGSKELARDPDVLDTWFSSALWPFATLGWPDDTPELRTFYPGDVNSTAREIIFLWENRMVMAGLELLGDIPFHDVIIHSTILASDGRRMSKSLGNGIDPVELIEQHGADATRYGLLKMSSTQDVRFSRAADRGGPPAREQALEREPAAADERRRARSTRGRRRSRSAGSSRASMPRAPRSSATLEAFDFAHAVDRLYHLTFDDFCDWYLESIKPRLAEPDVQATALAALERLLKLLHPVMPHVTEEIWSHLPARASRLIVAPWPEPAPDFEAELNALDQAQTAARIYRRSGVRINVSGDAERIFKAVVRPTGNGHGDVEGERARLAKEIERAEKMLANERFVANAAPDVVEGERLKLEQYRAELDALGD